jgi:hypothetical protein
LISKEGALIYRNVKTGAEIIVNSKIISPNFVLVEDEKKAKEAPKKEPPKQEPIKEEIPVEQPKRQTQRRRRERYE